MEEKEQVECESGGIEMNRWIDGLGVGAPTEVLSGESLGGSGGVAEGFSHKKRRPAHFILS